MYTGPMKNRRPGALGLLRSAGKTRSPSRGRMMVRRYEEGGPVEGNDYGVGGGYDFGMRDSLDTLIGGVDQGPTHNSAWGREDAIDRGLPEGIVDSLNQAWSNPEPGMTPGQSWSAARDNLGLQDVNQNWLERQLDIYKEPTYDPVNNRMGARHSSMDVNVPGAVAGLFMGPLAGMAAGAVGRANNIGQYNIPLSSRDSPRDMYGNVLVDGLSSPIAGMGQDGSMGMGGGEGMSMDIPGLSKEPEAPAAPAGVGSTVSKYMPYTGDPLRYGEGPGWNFYPQIKAAKGTFVEGPGAGQDDKVPALLSDGEFVIPADVVSMLGDGSSKAGADRLYQLMDEVRSHRATEGHPPKAKSPLQYMRGK